MLATINPEVGGVATDQKSRFYNVMCSIQALATAAAGATPTVNPVNSSGTRNTGYNCISVISNTEGGGWTAGYQNHFTASSTFDASASTQWLDLYKSTGKSSYPYYRIMFGLYNAPFNSSFTSYPAPEFWAGCTTANPSSAAGSSDSNFWTSVVNNTINSANSTAVGHPADYTTPQGRLRFDVANDTYTVAVTANYLIIATNAYLWYFGLRTVGGWEAARVDNPPWVCFGYTRVPNGGGGLSNNTTHYEFIGAFSAGIKQNGTQVAAARIGSAMSSSYNCVLTGYNPTTGPYGEHNTGIRFFAGDYTSYVYKAYSNIRTPLFYLNSNFGSYNTDASYGYKSFSDGPVADTVTGLNVPPAYPIVINPVDVSNASYATGVIPGIYKGMYGSQTHINYFVTASEYTIGGDSYLPVRTGERTYWDLFFLRKA